MIGNTYRIIDTRKDHTVLAVNDVTRPFALIAFGSKTGRILKVWRYAHLSWARSEMKHRIEYWAVRE